MSVLQKRERCLLCGRMDNLQAHHLFQAANRKLSTEFNLLVYLCPACHEGVTDYKGTIEIWSGNRQAVIYTMDLLHVLGQLAWEDSYGDRRDFINLFGRNYLG